jgi:hypothetical protein
MGLKMYFDEAGTQTILTAEKFAGAGPYNLTAFTGAQLGGVYKETKTSFAGITFSLGVGMGFTALVPSALKGQRVVHGTVYIGQITDNTDTTITVSDLTYTAGVAACYLSSYIKLYTPTDFTLVGNQITLVEMITANDVIHAIPVDSLAMYFGGTVGAIVAKTATVYVKRDAFFEYNMLQIASDDTSLFPYHVTTPAVEFTAGVGVGFSALPVNGLVGKAVNHDSLFRGVIVSNTATSVTLDTTYTGILAIAEIYNIGSLTFSLDNTTFVPVLALPNMSGVTTTIPVYLQDKVSIPTVAINYPSNIIVVSGMEYIA